MKKAIVIFSSICCLLMLVACQMLPEKQPVFPTPTATPTPKPSPIKSLIPMDSVVIFGTQPSIEFQTPEPTPEPTPTPTPEPTPTPTPVPTPTPTPVPTTNRDNVLFDDWNQDGKEDTITVTYTNGEYTTLGMPLNLKIEVNGVAYAVDDSSLNLSEDFYIGHTDFFFCDVDYDGRKEIVFGFQQLSNLPNEKIVVFKYTDNEMIQLPDPMSVDLKFNCTGDKYVLYLDGIACKEFPLDERITYGKEYQYKADSYELRVERVTLENDKLKIAFYFYEMNDNLESEPITAILTYQDGAWQVEDVA